MTWEAGGERGVEGYHAAIVDAVVYGLPSLRRSVAGGGTIPVPGGKGVTITKE